jgi:hypothetical protein
MDKETPAKNGQVIIKASTDRGKTFWRENKPKQFYRG